jgi:Ca-activated chloride channel family protein
MTLRRAFVAGVALLAGGFAFCGASARAQGTPGPIVPKPGGTVQKPPENTIRVKVAEVNAPVAVHDGNGELVLDLQQKDFHVLDNGVEQRIDSFDLGSEPLSAVLVFETSSRIAPLLPAVQKSAILFTQTIIGPSGDAAVLGYDDSVQQLLPFTADHDKIEKTITNLKAGNSGARLYDAISAAVGLLRDRPTNRRRAIIVVAEASDTGSEIKLGAVLRDAQLSNIVIYSVGLSTTAAQLRSPPSQSGPISATPPGTFGMPPIPGTAQTPTSEQQQREGNIDVLALAVWAVQHATAVVKDRPLEVATVATGGMYESTFRDKSIEKAVDEIGGELNAQYTLTYHPNNSDTSGFHEIKVTVDRPGVKVRTRPGYYVGEK